MSKKPSKIRLSTTQIVTIILSILTLLGLVIPAYLQYFAPAKLSINSTQTAQAQGITNTSVVSNQTFPAAFATTSLESWSNIIQVKTHLENTCSIAFMFPGNIDPMVDPVKSMEEYYLQNKTELVDTWIRVPAWGGQIIVQVSGLPDNQSWAQLESEAQVSISVNNNIPDHVNLIQDCGGEAEIRNFETITLESSNVTGYSLNVRYPDADFFTLQPGEFEQFGFSLICKSPGAYGLTINLPFAYEDNEGLIQLLSQPLLCPKSFTMWSALAGPPLINMGSYEWNGTTYLEVSR